MLNLATTHGTQFLSILIIKNNAMRLNNFSREMTFAIIIKFTLFGLVWWFFFAGQKIKVDEQQLTTRLLGDTVSKQEKIQ